MSTGRQGFHSQAQQLHLERQRRGARGGGVDAGAEALEQGAQLRVERRRLALGDAADAERPHQPVDRQPLLPGHLGDLALDRAAVEVHLPEPVLGVDEALGEVEVALGVGLDVGNAPAVAPHPHPALQPADLDRPPLLGQRPPRQPVPGRRRRRGGDPGAREPGEEPRPRHLPFAQAAHSDCFYQLAGRPGSSALLILLLPVLWSEDISTSSEHKGEGGMGKRGSIRTAVGLALAALAITASTAAAKPGTLDPTFGEAGRAATALDLGSPWENASIEMATAPDSSIVVSSKRQLVRYLPSGQLDRDWGDGGIVTLDQLEGLSFELDDVAVDSAGRVVAFGTAVDPSTRFRIPSYSGGIEQPTWAVILRFDTSGKPDSTFGAGGIVRTDLGLPMNQAEDGDPSPLIRTIGGIVDSQDRPMLVAAQFEEIPTEGHSYLGWVSRIIARLTPGGQLDPSFGAGDGVTVLTSSGYEGLLAASTGEPLLVWGGGPTRPRPLSQVARLRLDGQLETAYGSAGVRTISGGGGDIATDPFGRLLVLERPGDNPGRVLRLRPDGTLDPSFGRGGRATITLPAKASAINSIAVDSRGRAMLVGARACRSEHAAQGHADHFHSPPRVGEDGSDLWQWWMGQDRLRTGTRVAGVHEVAGMNRWPSLGPKPALTPKGASWSSPSRARHNYSRAGSSLPATG